MPEIRHTDDGSHTLYSRRFDQHYHTPNGSIAESRHVFFEQSDLLEALETGQPIELLETGFGTGLNLLLLLDYWTKAGSLPEITYHSVEAFPLEPGLVEQLNYRQHLHNPEWANKLPTIFGEAEEGINRWELAPGVTLILHIGLFNDLPLDAVTADYLFHDPFSPDVNPDLWTGKVFQKLLRHSTDQAVLTTYCAASKARGAMCWAGWHVARAEGALGKREMTVASPNPERLDGPGLERVNEERLAHRYETDDFD